MSDALLPTQDGGNSSDIKEVTLSMRKERLLKFKTKNSTQIWNKETSWSTIKPTMNSDNNGKSSMSMSTKSQRRVS